LGALLPAGAPAPAYNRRPLEYYIGQTDEHGDGNGDRDRPGEELGNTIANAAASSVLYNTDQEIIHIEKKRFRVELWCSLRFSTTAHCSPVFAFHLANDDADFMASMVKHAPRINLAVVCEPEWRRAT
jgi:hypothetical protein